MLSHGFKLIVIGRMHMIFAISNHCELNDFFGIIFTNGCKFSINKQGLKKYDYTMYMEKEYLKKLSKGQLIRLLLKQKKSKKVSNHENLLNNNPFKDEVAQEPAKPRTDRPLQMQNARRPPKPTRKPKDDFNFR